MTSAFFCVYFMIFLKKVCLKIVIIKPFATLFPTLVMVVIDWTLALSQPLMLARGALFQVFLFHPLRWDCCPYCIDFKDAEADVQRG